MNERRKYTVLRDLPMAGKIYRQGEHIELTRQEAKYHELNSVIELAEKAKPTKTKREGNKEAANG